MTSRRIMAAFYSARMARIARRDWGLGIGEGSELGLRSRSRSGKLGAGSRFPCSFRLQAEVTGTSRGKLEAGSDWD